MTIKLFLLFSVTVLGTVSGLFFSKKLTRRRRYFEELILLINSLISDFKLKQSSVCDLLSSFTGNEIKPTVNEFIRYAKGEDKELKLSKQELSERDTRRMLGPELQRTDEWDEAKEEAWE